MQRRMKLITRDMVNPSLVNREVWLEETDTFATIKDTDPSYDRPLWVERFPGSGIFRPNIHRGIYLLDPDEPGQMFYGSKCITWSEGVTHG